MFTTGFKSPLGWITVVNDGDRITKLWFGKPEKVTENELGKEAVRQLREYFSGERKTFELPLLLEGTEFQRKVWKALCEIPYGETCTYKEIARKCGNEKACRAVGMANHRNPIWIVVPCHRVVGSGGKLTGYAGGLERKQYLLEMEHKYSGRRE